MLRRKRVEGRVTNGPRPQQGLQDPLGGAQERCVHIVSQRHAPQPDTADHLGQNTTSTRLSRPQSTGNEMGADTLGPSALAVDDVMVKPAYILYLVSGTVGSQWTLPADPCPS
jgi:hypothetical protein